MCRTCTCARSQLVGSSSRSSNVEVAGLQIAHLFSRRTLPSAPGIRKKEKGRIKEYRKRLKKEAQPVSLQTCLASPLMPEALAMQPGSSQAAPPHKQIPFLETCQEIHKNKPENMTSTVLRSNMRTYFKPQSDLQKHAQDRQSKNLNKTILII